MSVTRAIAKDMNAVQQAAVHRRRPTGLCRPWRLSPELQAIVGVPVSSRVQLMKLLWGYLKTNRLQDNRDKRYFYPDQRLYKIFGYGRLRCFAMAKYLTPHLRSLDAAE